MWLILLSCTAELGPADPSSSVRPYATPPPPPHSESDCEDGRDNDLDLRIDCADPDCADSPLCPDEHCYDGQDNDADGRVDCQDPDCSASARCAEGYADNCFDGVDNDHNGLVDCEDSACTERIGCIEACTTDEDDDGDGLLNCEDADCWGARSCQSYTVQVVMGAFSSSHRWSRRTHESNRTAVYSGRSDLTTVQTYALYSTAFRRISTTMTTDLQGTLQVTSPMGAQDSCGFTMGGRWFRASSSGAQRRQSSVVFRSSLGACTSTTYGSSQPLRVSAYEDFNAGRPAFSSDCGLSTELQWLDLETGPFLAPRSPGSEGDTTVPNLQGPTPFIGTCGYTGTRTTSSARRWVTSSSGVFFDFGAQPQSWSFGQPR